MSETDSKQDTKLSPRPEIEVEETKQRETDPTPLDKSRLSAYGSTSTMRRISAGEYDQLGITDFPFDLNTLLNFNFGFDTLKHAIEYLARGQKKMDNKLGQFELTIHENIMNIKKQKGVDDKENATLMDIQGLEAKFDEFQKQFSVYTERSEQMKKNASAIFSLQNFKDEMKKDQEDIHLAQFKLKEQMKEHQQQIEIIQKTGYQIADLGGHSPDPDDEGGPRSGLSSGIEIKLDEYGRRLKALEFQTKELKAIGENEHDKYDVLNQLVTGMGGKINQMKADFDDTRGDKQRSLSKVFGPSETEPRLENLQEQINYLKENKTDAEIFDIETFKHKELLDALEQRLLSGEFNRQSSAGTVSTDHRQDQLIQEMKVKINYVEKTVDDIRREQTNIAAFKIPIQDLQKKTQNIIGKEQFDLIGEKQKHISITLSQQEAEVKILRDHMAELPSIKRTLNGLMRGPSESDFVNMRGRLDAGEKSDSQIRKTLIDHEKKIKNLKNGTDRVGKSPADPEAVEQMTDDISQQRLEFEEFKKNADRDIRVNQELLNKRATIQDLEDLETRLNEKIFDIQKKLAYFQLKEESSKRFNQLGRKIRETQELVLEKTSNLQDDGLITKKTMGAMQCASCQKDLVNMQGMRAEHHVWNQLPHRETNERIAKYGAGFSKILTTLRDEQSLGVQSSQNLIGGPIHSQHIHDKMTLKQVPSKAFAGHRASADFSYHPHQQSSGDINNHTTQASQYFQNHHDSAAGVSEIPGSMTGFFKKGKMGRLPGNMSSTVIEINEALANKRKHSSVIRNETATYNTNVPIVSIYQQSNNLNQQSVELQGVNPISTQQSPTTITPNNFSTIKLQTGHNRIDSRGRNNASELGLAMTLTPNRGSSMNANKTLPIQLEDGNKTIDAVPSLNEDVTLPMLTSRKQMNE